MGMKLKRFDLVEVEWEDSLSDDNRWQDVEGYDFDDLYSELSHKSSGYLIRRGKRGVTLALSIRENKKYMLGLMTIPRGCIKKIRKLTEAKK